MSKLSLFFPTSNRHKTVVDPLCIGGAEKSTTGSNGNYIRIRKIPDRHCLIFLISGKLYLKLEDEKSKCWINDKEIKFEDTKAKGVKLNIDDKVCVREQKVTTFIVEKYEKNKNEVQVANGEIIPQTPAPVKKNPEKIVPEKPQKMDLSQEDEEEEKIQKKPTEPKKTQNTKKHDEEPQVEEELNKKVNKLKISKKDQNKSGTEETEENKEEEEKVIKKDSNSIKKNDKDSEDEEPTYPKIPHKKSTQNLPNKDEKPTKEKKQPPKPDAVLKEINPPAEKNNSEKTKSDKPEKTKSDKSEKTTSKPEKSKQRSKKRSRHSKKSKYDFLSSGSDEENESINESYTDESTQESEEEKEVVGAYAFKAAINSRSRIAKNKAMKIEYNSEEEVDEERPKTRRHNRQGVNIVMKGDNYQQLDYWKGKKYI